ncbi:DUF305 domain-containing protein [Pseudoclavibacter sp. Marseille-Q4354]|nr:DUF305 domain-containing protein [Pseudoclavibacter sp. Marseille-Q4354]
MKHSRIVLLSTTTLAAALALAACSPTSAPDSMGGMDHSTMTETTPSPSSAATGDANDQDVMFAQMMVPHHEQAVEMSDMILAKSDINPEVTTLAEEIKAAQGPEIEQLNQWLSDWGAESMSGMDHSMDGMMSDEDMANLDAATGDDASRLFLEQMIEHHEGAVSMAQEEVDNGLNSDATALAQTIVDTQTTEIETMRELLTSLA